ncbi:MAG: GNAT family N-acetyltransferase [Candidatus Hydrogenedentes bacterium]|nr:GNAT family N-acetyltransferase [Candidatus Hydrogenedentota bacterium]
MQKAKNTYLRRADREDLDKLVCWMEDEDFNYFLYGDPARSPSIIREQIVSYLGKSAGSVLPTGLYLLIDGPEGPIGMVSLQNISWRNRSCNIDVYISKPYRGQVTTGIGVFRALEYAFDELNMHRVGAVIYAFNELSWKFFEFVGAVREVVLKDHILRDGKFYDVFVYGLLDREFNDWRDKHKKSIQEFELRRMIESINRSESNL